LTDLKAADRPASMMGRNLAGVPMTDPEIRNAVFAALALAAASALACEADAQEPGRRLAEAYCGQCHALGSGPSPLADAPPFATLHLRYPEGGGLEDLLGEGMIAPAIPPEEGQPRLHPRMPQAHLDDDQIADLIAFLKSAQRPAARVASPRGS
jgi:mono/diheme cytochrome c family protein